MWGAPTDEWFDQKDEQDVVSVLYTYVNSEHDDWDDHLPWAILSFNSTWNEVKKRSPFELVYGRVDNLPIDSVLPCALMTLHLPETFRSHIMRLRKEARESVINNQKQVKSPIRCPPQAIAA